ncbi:MAG: helix-turn-helix domain-containing protein [Firmicutes bacterium]|jgi:transcriptional regulator with XRE-family HTH domain|nr:helix-turn-helix domain-containing protein [Bacillota bacterium]
MNIDYKLIGERIKKFRQEKAITQSTLSEMLDVSNVYVSKIERGVARVNLEMLFKISTLLEVSVSQLLTGIDEDANNYLDVEISKLMEHSSVEEKRMIYNVVKAIIKD